MARYNNTRPMRVFPEDIDFLNELSLERIKKGVDRKQQTPARMLKGYINITKMDPKLKKLITEAQMR